MAGYSENVKLGAIYLFKIKCQY